MPRVPSQRIRPGRSTLPCAFGNVITSAPMARSAAAFSERSGSGSAHTMTQGSPCSRRASSGTPSLLSTSTRKGWRAVSTARTVICGLSSSTVPMPVRTAQARARQAWPSARAAGPVIHWLSPDGSAVRLSRLAAIFIRTHGRPRVMRETKPIFISRASFSSRPQRTSMPAVRSVVRPRPDTSGLGSSIAAITRASLASISAFAQGGVRPKWLHGSSET